MEPPNLPASWEGPVGPWQGLAGHLSSCLCRCHAGKATLSPAEKQEEGTESDGHSPDLLHSVRVAQQWARAPCPSPDEPLQQDGHQPRGGSHSGTSLSVIYHCDRHTQWAACPTVGADTWMSWRDLRHAEWDEAVSTHQPGRVRPGKVLSAQTQSQKADPKLVTWVPAGRGRTSVPRLSFLP